MKQSPTNELTQKILADLFKRGVFAWRQNTIGSPVRSGGAVVAIRAAGKTGVSDICSVIPGGKFLAIEVKTGKDRMRPEQEGFKASVEYVGGYYLVVHTWEDYIQKISTVSELLHKIVSRGIVMP